MQHTFSGHESFQCKGLWLKKGYDFVKAGRSFNDDTAVVDLGVGKNMVASIRFWLKAFGIVGENGEITEIGRLILDDEGKDPYIEDLGTLWLLHYLLVTTNVATLYNLVFTEFNKTRKDFNKQTIMSFVKRLFADRRFGNMPCNEKTIDRDISTLLKNYVYPDNFKACEDYSAVLLDLKLIERIDREHFAFNSSTKAQFHPLVFLFAVLDSTGGEQVVVEFSTLLQLAGIFGLSVNELYDIFDQLHEINPNIEFRNTAGEQLFTINEPLNKWQVLNAYYGEE